ncbi:MAG TPA: serine/threonine-protein kinase [Thermoanaerobaculia bacterium]|nr:serine/threonine-protein kinase [Thermoanaerobaculia bacterium]
MSGPIDLYGHPWSWREYVVVLDAYFQLRGQPRNPESQTVQELARLTGRTPASICMRMENFASIDPEQTNARRGLAHVSPMCKTVFDEWKAKPHELRQVATAFRRDAEERWDSARTLFDLNPVRVPKAFKRYELLDLIGQGAFARVFSSIDIDTGEAVAIKVIDTEKISDRECLQRFVREIRALKSVSHRNVIRLREDNIDSEENFPGYVMDLAECSLTTHVTECRRETAGRPFLGREEAAGVMIAVADACVALHGHTPCIIHRDINPNNILRLPGGRWVLADFGLAKFIGSAQVTTAFATQTQVGWGTSYYAAPEQYRDFKGADERTDVYALGVLLWELFSSSWPPPMHQKSGLPEDLQRVFIKATEREPNDRYRSACEFLEDLHLAELVRA